MGKAVWRSIKGFPRRNAGELFDVKYLLIFDYSVDFGNQLSYDIGNQ